MRSSCWWFKNLFNHLKLVGRIPLTTDIGCHRGQMMTIKVLVVSLQVHKSSPVRLERWLHRNFALKMASTCFGMPSPPQEVRPSEGIGNWGTLKIPWHHSKTNNKTHAKSSPLLQLNDSDLWRFSWGWTFPRKRVNTHHVFFNWVVFIRVRISLCFHSTRTIQNAHNWSGTFSRMIHRVM